MLKNKELLFFNITVHLYMVILPANMLFGAVLNGIEDFILYRTIEKTMFTFQQCPNNHWSDLFKG